MALTRSSGIGFVGLDEVVADARVREDVKDKFGSLLSLYEQYLDLPVGHEVYDGGNHNSPWLLKNVTQCITPDELNLFIECTKMYESHCRYNDIEGRTGLYLTQLMRIAYEQNHSKFNLDFNVLKPIHFVGMGLKQVHNKPLDIIIKGQIGHSCFCNAYIKNATFDSIGNWSLVKSKIDEIRFRTARHWCLTEADAGAVYFCSADTPFLHLASVYEVYTIPSSRKFITDVIEQKHIHWKSGQRVHFTSDDDMQKKMEMNA